MRILIFGAGVIGSLYGARLQQAGHRVTMLARGQRLVELRTHGIVLEDALTGVQTHTAVDSIEQLASDDCYDLILVVVRKDQVDEALPSLAANEGSSLILFMVNNPCGYAGWAEAVGRERTLVGFAGAGGTRRGHIVSYTMAPPALQATTLGEIDGALTPRLQTVAAVLRAAGFPVALCRNMDAWQKSHLAWVGPLAHAIYATDDSNYRLAHTPDALVLLVRAIREGLHALSAVGVPITPLRLRVWQVVPEPIMVAVLSRALNTRTVEVLATRHAVAARNEMRLLNVEYRSVIRKSGMPTPSLDCLAEYVEQDRPPMSEGAHSLTLRWGEFWWMLALLAGVALAARSTRRVMRRLSG